MAFRRERSALRFQVRYGEQSSAPLRLDFLEINTDAATACAALQFCIWCHRLAAPSHGAGHPWWYFDFWRGWALVDRRCSAPCISPKSRRQSGGAAWLDYSSSTSSLEY